MWAGMLVLVERSQILFDEEERAGHCGTREDRDGGV